MEQRSKWCRLESNKDHYDMLINLDLVAQIVKGDNKIIFTMIDGKYIEILGSEDLILDNIFMNLIRYTSNNA